MHDFVAVPALPETKAFPKLLVGKSNFKIRGHQINGRGQCVQHRIQPLTLFQQGLLDRRRSRA